MAEDDFDPLSAYPHKDEYPRKWVPALCAIGWPGKQNVGAANFTFPEPLYIFKLLEPSFPEPPASHVLRAMRFVADFLSGKDPIADPVSIQELLGAITANSRLTKGEVAWAVSRLAEKSLLVVRPPAAWSFHTNLNGSESWPDRFSKKMIYGITLPLEQGAVYGNTSLWAWRRHNDVTDISDVETVVNVPHPTKPKGEEADGKESGGSNLNERDFMQMAIDEARQSVGEDGRAHPKVGAVIVKDGTVLASAHRGELGQGEHAEYTALERKLAAETVAGATVYATLEPCTTRNHPKVPCAHRLIERRVKRVVFGMLDPNPEICGKGERFLRDHGIVVDRFPDELIIQLEELNRDFTRAKSNVASGRTALLSAIDELVAFVRERAGETWPPAPPLDQHAEQQLQELDSQVYGLAANNGLSIPPISMPVDPLTQLVNSMTLWGLTKIPSTRTKDGLRVYPFENWLQAMKGLRATADAGSAGRGLNSAKGQR
jgi:pyrimidine deaminase RibD-like protein